MSLVLLVREFSHVDILRYGVYPGMGYFAHLAYPDSGYRGIRLVIDGRNIISVIGRDAATTAKAFSFSLQSLEICFSFQAEKLPKRCLTRATYFAIQGSRDSYSSFTCPTTNWESLRIMSLSDDIAAANSIQAKMASYYDSLFEVLKPNRIACSILSPLGDFSCRPMPALVCRDAQSTLRVYQFKLSRHVSVWGICNTPNYTLTV